MKQFGVEKIKNIALAGHSGSGKTSLAEALIYKAGMSDRLGKVADGNTICDFDAEEIKRKATLQPKLFCLRKKSKMGSSLLHWWKDVLVNLFLTEIGIL